ncbi:MAG: OprO/OprP family phosphate-selective porin [Myxococcales bacterium]|nr:OprO/OprP family phosphate-selective porin [Myxococcales bacterium]
MTPNGRICHALVALAALGFTNIGLAQEEEEAAAEGSAQGVPVDGEPSARGAQAVVEEPPGEEPEESTSVVETPPSEPEASPSEGRILGEELRPKGEEEMMGAHPVEPGGIAFKPGKGLEINSADGDFQLRIRVRVQFLYTLVRGNVGPREADEPEELRNEFQIRRARFIFQGNAFGKDNHYKLEIDPTRPDSVVLDYYLDFTQNKNVEVRVGQYKLSSNRERVISSGDLQMVDRSQVNSEFSLDRDIGVDIRSRDFLGKNKMRYVLGISAGNGINNFRFQDFGVVYLIRLEYLPLGIFDDYTEADFERTKPRLSLGATYAFFNNADQVRGMVGAPFADGGTANYNFAYVDAMFKARGFSLLSEFALRTGTRSIGDITTDPDGNPVEPTAPRNGVGWMAQAGYMIPKIRLEFAGRGSIIRSITSNTSLPESNGVTFSLSWYFFEHPFKIQADVSEDWSTSEAFGDGGTTVRIQLQASL